LNNKGHAIVRTISCFGRVDRDGSVVLLTWTLDDLDSQNFAVASPLPQCSKSWTQKNICYEEGTEAMIELAVHTASAVNVCICYPVMLK
jgi:hypothetical protein